MPTIKDHLTVTLEAGAEKFHGIVMKINYTGMLVELEKITFKIGGIVVAHLDVGGLTVTEQVRSIKHYDRFFRSLLKRKKKNPDEPEPQPKKLAELHFVKLSEMGRSAISRHMIELQAKAGRAK